MNRMKIIIEQKIERLWKKPCNNASDAHFRAQELTRLQKQLERCQEDT